MEESSGTGTGTGTGSVSKRLLEEVGGAIVDIEKRELGKSLARPREPWKIEYMKSLVDGGLDAIITCFSLISSITATSRYSSVNIMVLVLANLVGIGISAGFDDFVSSYTERDMAEEESTVIKWDLVNRSKAAEMDLLDQYQALGMDPNDARIVVEIFSKYKDILVDEKMVAQKRILPSDEKEKPWRNGALTFIAFVVFGSIPLTSFLVLIPFTQSDSIMFLCACIVTMLSLVFLGVVKAQVAGENYFVSAATTVADGAITASAAYAVGWTLKTAFGIEMDNP
ncbi:hypothetical protein ACFE04_018309 [Oxalis oulophora]